MPNLPILAIGGGPAGACVSALLARRGYPVTLLERERFPRAHVGESLLPASIPILDDLGVLDTVRRAGFVVQESIRRCSLWLQSRLHLAKITEIIYAYDA